MNSRTVIEFDYPQEIWTIFDSWAKAENFRLLSGEGAKRQYQKGHGILVLPTKIEISQINGRVRLEAWIQNQFITRLITLYLTPAETKLESGGVLFIIPRALSRDSLNKFLAQIQQPLIK